jgi:hypothetical protein
MRSAKHVRSVVVATVLAVASSAVGCDTPSEPTPPRVGSLTDSVVTGALSDWGFNEVR